jgi:hypothetical protein
MFFLVVATSRTDNNAFEDIQRAKVCPSSKKHNKNITTM